MDCLDRFWQISLNVSTYKTDFSFYQHPETDQVGLLTYLPTKDLPNGQHTLKVTAKEKLIQLLQKPQMLASPFG
jgi:hypothetical protein